MAGSGDNAELSNVSYYFRDLHEWSYRCEGSWTMVVSLRKLKTVLRLRKRDYKNSPVEAGQKSDDCVREIFMRNLEFAKHVMLPLMGDEYVHVGKVISVPEGFAASMNEICRGLRPDHRLDKEIDKSCSFGVLMPDFCFLPLRRVACSAKEIGTNHPTFSVELKPKCGFLPSSTYIDSIRKTKYSVCHYCMLQKSKVKEGKYKRESNYCPLDLFSGDPKRIMYALQCLVSDPQNNLRVFCDGIGIFTEELVQEAIQDGRTCCAEKHFEMALQQFKVFSDCMTADNICGNNVTRECHRHEDCVTTGGCKMEDCMTTEGNKCDMTTDDKCGDDVTTEPHRCGHVGPFSRQFLNILLEILIDDSKTNQVQASHVTVSPTTLMCKQSKYLESNVDIQRLNCQQFGNGGVLQKLLLVQKLDDIDVEGIYPLYKRVVNHFEYNPGLRDSLGVDGPFSLPLWKTVASTLSNISDRITSAPTIPVLNSDLNDPHNLNDAVLKICKFAVACTGKDCSVMLAFQKTSKKEAVLPAVEITCGDLYHYNIDLVDLDPKEFDRVVKYYNDTKKTVEVFLKQ